MPTPKRRFRPFKILWLLLAGLALGALTLWLTVWLPFQRQQEAIGELRAAWASVRIDDGGPGWLRSLLGDERMQIFDRVREVSFSFTSEEIPVEVLRHLHHLRGLKSLSLVGRNINDAHVARVQGLSSLEELYLYDSPNITDAGIRHLADLHNLKKLHISETQTTDDGLAELAGLPNLRILFLYNTRVTHAGLVHLATFPQLVEVGLDEGQIDGGGLRHLSGLTRLTDLRLASDTATDDDLKHIAGLTNLTFLTISSPHITDAGIKHLYGLTKLEFLRVDATRITNAGLAALKAALPSCEVKLRSPPPMPSSSPT